MSPRIDHDLRFLADYPGVVGVDEVGRGPLAGSIVVAACYLDAEIIEANRPLLEKANDSKQVSEKKRLVIARELLLESTVPLVVVEASPRLVDRLNPLQATVACWKKAIQVLHAGFTPGVVLVDGAYVWPGAKYPLVPVVKGDATSCAIACASIVAKVIRDGQMVQADSDDLDSLGYTYNHSKHKGYGTPEHLLLLRKYGPSKRHRLTFDPLKTWISQGSIPLP